MKKFICLLGLALCCMIAFTSCESRSTEKKADAAEKTDSVTELVVENTISIDRQDMFLHYKNDYRWYETCIVLKDFMDDENCDGTISGISNIFQYVIGEEGKAFDTWVVMYSHVGDTTQVDVKYGFWVEDYPLNDEVIKVTFKEAFAKLMEANCTKPHSRHCVLRKEIGAIDCNPQYIFGNSHAQVYVDATTGEVRLNDPAFPDTFKKPLGEWP